MCRVIVQGLGLRRELLKLHRRMTLRGSPDPASLSRIAAQSSVLFSGRLTTSVLFELCLRRGDKEAALGYRNFLGGLEKLKALPLKDRRRHLKNEIFRISIIMLLSGFVLYLLSHLSLF